MHQPPTTSPDRRPRSATPRGALRGRRGAALALGLGLMVTVSACSSGNGGNSASSTSPSSATGTHTTASAATSSPARSATTKSSAPPPVTKPPASCVDRTVSAMSVSQRVGQLFMSAINSTGVTGAEATAITHGKVGGVFLMGHTNTGTSAVKGVTDRAKALATTVPGVKLHLLISTDQEGGQVQVLNGPGFSVIPSAVTQGQWSTSHLQQQATVWGGQLRAAGLSMNLAPVADTVPPDLVGVNAPIGLLDREYGNDPSAVASHSDAFLRGMRAAGVLPTIKHFPGLGRVRGNTDLAANVVDSVTTRTDPYLQPFRSGIQAGTPFVMVSNAKYALIDPARQAAFSPVIMRDLLRGSLGFKGVIISDDLGAAVAVSDRSPGQRAVDYLTAGGNIVLTVRPGDIAPMTAAVLAKLPNSSALRAAVDDSVHRVLNLKHNAGLLSCS